jgi:hypothetical protein
MEPQINADSRRSEMKKIKGSDSAGDALHPNLAFLFLF